MPPRAPGRPSPEQLLAVLRSSHPEGEAIAHGVELLRAGRADWYQANTSARMKELIAAWLQRHPDVLPDGWVDWAVRAALAHRRRDEDWPYRSGFRVTGR